MRFMFGSMPEVLPADWVWFVEPAAGGTYRIRIERPSGVRMTLPDALNAAAIEMTSSRPQNKTATTPGDRK